MTEPKNPAGQTKPDQSSPGEWSEETNRRAARKSVDETEDDLEQELEDGLDESFPASDPPTATRPGAKEEDEREEKGG